MKQGRYFILLLLLIVSGMQSGCVKEQEGAVQPGIDHRPMLTILKNNYAFSMLYSALLRTGLEQTLEGDGPFTLLAPDNDAFNSIGITADSLNRMNVEALKKLIAYHIIPEAIPYESVPQTVDFTYPTLAETPVYFSVPIPGSLQFQNLNANIVHINGAKAKKTDIKARNGFIIVLGRPLRLPAPTVKTILENDTRFSLFTKALKKFGLFDQLDKPGPFVVMAPTNDAFLMYGIDEAAIDALDTVSYRKYLFSAYLLPSHRFFATDLADAPLDRLVPPGIITPDYIQVMRQGSDYAPAGFGLMSLDYKIIQGLALPPYYGDAYIWGPAVDISDPDHLALNGVVHGLSGLVMLPESARIP